MVTLTLGLVTAVVGGIVLLELKCIEWLIDRFKPAPAESGYEDKPNLFQSKITGFRLRDLKNMSSKEERIAYLEKIVEYGPGSGCHYRAFKNFKVMLSVYKNDTLCSNKEKIAFLEECVEGGQPGLYCPPEDFEYFKAALSACKASG